MQTYFDHEKLIVYQKSIEFIAWTHEFLQKVKGRPAIKDQLDHASVSIALNIAEGNGKFYTRDRCRYLQIALGSAMECAACLDVGHVQKRLTMAERDTGKQQLQLIVNMLVGLLRQQQDKFREEPAEYHTESE